MKYRVFYFIGGSFLIPKRRIEVVIREATFNYALSIANTVRKW
jgi:hypothetical protein